MPLPANTRSPAVASVPPLHGCSYSTRHDFLLRHRIPRGKMTLRAGLDLRDRLLVFDGSEPAPKSTPTLKLSEVARKLLSGM